MIDLHSRQRTTAPSSPTAMPGSLCQVADAVEPNLPVIGAGAGEGAALLYSRFSGKPVTDLTDSLSRLLVFRLPKSVVVMKRAEKVFDVLPPSPCASAPRPVLDEHEAADELAR